MLNGKICGMLHIIVNTYNKIQTVFLFYTFSIFSGFRVKWIKPIEPIYYYRIYSDSKGIYVELFHRKYRFLAPLNPKVCFNKYTSE